MGQELETSKKENKIVDKNNMQPQNSLHSSLSSKPLTKLRSLQTSLSGGRVAKAKEKIKTLLKTEITSNKSSKEI